MLCSIGAKNSAPYNGVVTHGWTLDDQGRAQSKSLGNTTDPVDIAKRMGGEIIRMWASSVDFREDVVGSEKLMLQVSENYRKIRNTFKYILGNLHEFEPARDAVPNDQLQSIDRYMLHRTAELSKDIRKWYAQFQFHRVYQLLLAFCSDDLSHLYFDVLKDRLYTSGKLSPERRSAQTAIWKIGEALVRLCAPVMSFTADEIWQFLPKIADRTQSVHMATFMDETELAGSPDAQLVSDWQTILRSREDVLKALDEARNKKLIGTGLEAKVTLDAPASLYPVLEKYADQLRYVYIVSEVELKRSAESNGTGNVRVTVERAAGQKCERCWNYSTHVGEDANYPTVCERCSKVLPEFETAAAAS
jgi:isoleucyl-tRNA synthetase